MAGVFGFSVRPPAWIAAWDAAWDAGWAAVAKPSSTGARLLAGFCIRGRSVFERAMTRDRGRRLPKSWVFRARAGGLPSGRISWGFDGFARFRVKSGS